MSTPINGILELRSVVCCCGHFAHLPGTRQRHPGCSCDTPQGRSTHGQRTPRDQNKGGKRNEGGSEVFLARGVTLLRVGCQWLHGEPTSRCQARGFLAPAVALPPTKIPRKNLPVRRSGREKESERERRNRDDIECGVYCSVRAKNGGNLGPGNQAPYTTAHALLIRIAAADGEALTNAYTMRSRGNCAVKVGRSFCTQRLRSAH